ncbi:MAG: DUF1493 family protein [Candidatus Solibacter usitatus]|nr:DUF1493 family protein [Candidatus Solibacter usitatus]
MYTYDDILDFVSSQVGGDRAEITPETSLRDDFGVSGDDFGELVQAFAERFHVDMSGYRWYFHHEGEVGINIGAWFYPSPDKQVARIPVTPQVLLESANAGRWVVTYPPHKMDRIRWDLVMNMALLILPLLALIAAYLWSPIHQILR